MFVIGKELLNRIIDNYESKLGVKTELDVLFGLLLSNELCTNEKNLERIEYEMDEEFWEFYIDRHSQFLTKKQLSLMLAIKSVQKLKVIFKSILDYCQWFNPEINDFLIKFLLTEDT